MRFIFLIYCYVPSFCFRHYFLSTKNKKDGQKISLRCHRQKHCWELLTKRYVSIIGIRVPVLEWTIFDEHCSWHKMRKTFSAEGLKITGTKWHTLHAHDIDSMEKLFPFSIPAEKLSAT